jgi:predicted ATPase
LQVAAELLDEFSGGAWFANLAPIGVTDTGMVTCTIAQVLGVKESGGRLLMDSLKEYVREKELLLLLDNFEQVVEARSQVAELVMAAPRLKVLVTSRLPLQVRGEREWPVPPLALPDTNNLPPIERLTQYESVRLFIERAASIKADFEVTNDNAPAIAEICARLDGLPLAIELAAARIRLLTPQTMLPRLHSRLKLLSGGLKDLPARQQTLRSTIEWSHDLLSDQEKTLFRRLSVFQRGRTLEAIEAVCVPQTIDDSSLNNLRGTLVTASNSHSVDILPHVESLIAQNLLRQEEGVSGESRFTMLETIQEYALEKLDESGEAGEIRRRHALYFMALAEEAETHLTDAGQREWTDRLEYELDNMWAVLRWARERGYQGDKVAVDIALRLGGALRRWWMVRGYFSQAREELDGLLSIAATLGCSGEGMAKALNSAGTLAWSQGDYPAARAALEQALLFGREAGAKSAIAITLNGLGIIASDQGDYTLARSFSEEGLALVRELGDKRAIAIEIHNLENLARSQGDYEAARSLFEEKVSLLREARDKQSSAWILSDLSGVAYSEGDNDAAYTLARQGLALHRELGENRSVAKSLNFLGVIALTKGDYDAARAYSEEALEIYRKLGDKQGIADSYTRLGDVAWYEGEYDNAHALYQDGLILRRELGEKRYVAISLNNLALTALMQGDYELAWSLCEESLIMRRDLGDKLGIAYSLGGLGTIAVSMGHPQRGARLLGAAEALLKVLEGVKDVESPLPYDQGIASTHAQSGQDDFEHDWGGGRAMSMEEAIAYALEES